MRRFTSIRWRLTLWYVAILGVILIVFSSVIYEAEARAASAQQQSALRGQARQLAARADPVTWQFDLASSGGVVEAAMAQNGASPTDKDLQATKRALATGNNQQIKNIGADQGFVGTPATPEASPGTSTAGTPASISPGLVGSDSNATQTNPTSQTSNPPSTLLGPSDVALLFDERGNFRRAFGPIDAADTKRLLSTDPKIVSPQAADTFFSQQLTEAKGGQSVSGQPYLFYATPLLIKNQLVGTLVVGHPNQTTGQLHRLLLILLLTIPATLLLAAAGGYWLAARAMRPVRAITRAAQEIGESDLSRRIDLPGRDELGELAGTFDRMLDRLEAAFRRQRQFTSDASHELRTPLTIVNLEVEHALTDGDLLPEQQRALTTIQAENAYMTRLVNDLLTLARADAGRVVPRLERLDLSDLALDVVERLAPLARERGIEIEVGPLPELPISGDRLYLTQMLTNVVENAIKYTAGNGCWVRVEADNDDGPSDIAARGWVRISDSGPGIAAEHLPHLFERFYRVDQARGGADPDGDHTAGSPGGSGLGLAIVQWVAESHGGEVAIESQPGQGTCVEIALPLAGELPSPPAPLPVRRCAMAANHTADSVMASRPGRPSAGR